MIARLTGEVLEKGAESLVIDVQGVGYLVHASLETLARCPPAGETVRLRVVTQVREDAIELFGFHSPLEELVFTKLIQIPSIGPRKAINILSSLPAEEVIAAVRDEDAKRLSQANGVGKKTAERLILELKDKVAGLSAGAEGAPAAPTHRALADDLVAGLEGLGYRREQAEEAARGVLKARPEGELPELLREALSLLRKA